MGPQRTWTATLHGEAGSGCLLGLPPAVSSSFPHLKLSLPVGASHPHSQSWWPRGLTQPVVSGEGT